MQPVSGVGEGDILLDHVTCTGKEKDIFNCANNNWNSSDTTRCYNHNSDAAVKCFRSGKSILKKKIKLLIGRY